MKKFSHLLDKFSCLWSFPVTLWQQIWRYKCIETVYVVCLINKLLGILNASVPNTVCCVVQWCREKSVNLMLMKCFSFSTQHKWRDRHCPPSPGEEENPYSLGTEEVLMFMLFQIPWRHDARQCLAWVPDRHQLTVSVSLPKCWIPGTWQYWKPSHKYLN